MKKIILYSLLACLLLVLSLFAWYQFGKASDKVISKKVGLVKLFHGHRNVVTAVRFIKDSLLLSSSADSTIRIYSLNTNTLLRTIRQPAGIAYMDVSKEYIVTGGYDSKVRLYNNVSGALLREFTGHAGTVWTVDFNHQGTQVASAGDDKNIILWNLATGKAISTLKGHKRIVWSAKYSPGDDYLASGSFDFSQKLWNLETMELEWNNTGHSETVVDLAFDDNGLLATTSDDKTIKLWDWRKKQLVRTMVVAEHVQAAAFSPDSRLLLTGGRDKTMFGELFQNFMGNSTYNKGISARLWDVSTGTLIHTIQEHGNDVQDVAFSDSGKYFATASADHSVILWRIN